MKINNEKNVGPIAIVTKMLANAQKKYFLPSIECINKFASGGKYKINLEYENINTKQTENNIFSLSIPETKEAGIPFEVIFPNMLPIGGVKYLESYGLANKLIITKGRKKFIVEGNSVKDFQANFPGKPQKVQGNFSNFKSFNKEKSTAFYRLIIKVEDTHMSYPTSILDFDNNHMVFDIPNWDVQKSVMGISFPSTKGMFSELNIQNYKFHFYALEPINSFVIDSAQKISKERFITITQCIRTCFAFLSGKFYKGETVYLSSKAKHFKRIINFDIIIEGPSIITNNRVINPDTFFDHYNKQDQKVKDGWSAYHTMFPTKTFSQLCEQALKSPELLRSIQLVINAGTLNDPIQKGALYSVSIETISEYLKSTNEKAYAPIKDKALSKKVIKALHATLDNIKKEIDADAYAILSNKIGNINSTTNRNKLTLPFTLLGITLNADELKILEHRNDYLHGGKPSKTEFNFDLEGIALHLHSLISKLILKHAGYSGHFIHLPGWTLLQNRDVMASIKKIDFAEVFKIFKMIDSDELNSIQELQHAREVLENYKLFNRITKELECLVQII